LAECHTKKLFPTRKMFGFIIAFVSINTCSKHLMGDKLHYLGKDIFALIHTY